MNFVMLLGNILSMLLQKNMMFQPLVSRETRIQSELHNCFLDNREDKYRDTNISAIVAPMVKPACKDVCIFTIHMWVNLFVKQSNGFLATHASTDCTAAAGQQGQRAQEK